MTLKSKVPEVRFDGFSGEWEEKELDIIADVLDGDRGNNYPNGNELQELGHTLFLSASNVTKNGFKFNTKQYITEKKSNSMGNGKLLVDDIILTSRGSIGHIAWYNKYIQEQIPFARINSGMLILRSNSVVPSIVAQFLKSPIGQKKINLISFGSAQPQLTKQSVSIYTVIFPSDEVEQTKIGTYFQHLDSLITQHQQKHEKLLNIKKAMLEKMFPKEGADVPEIRFEGFGNKWAIKNFKSLTKINQGLQIAISNRYTKKIDGSFFYITNEFLKEGSDTKYYILNPPENVLCTENDILMTRTGNTGEVVTNIAGAFHNNFFKIKFDSEELNKNFFIYYLRLSKTQTIISKLAGTSTIPDLNHNDFYRIEIAFSSLAEQTKIGNFFTKLDDLISLQQSKLKKLKNIKKASLEKMFV